MPRTFRGGIYFNGRIVERWELLNKRRYQQGINLNEVSDRGYDEERKRNKAKSD